MRVCQEWFPNEKKPKKSGFYMHDGLAMQIQIAAKNITKDWDFTIIITGGGEVRVGKSVLALQIAMYWSYLMKEIHNINVPFNFNNIVFQWRKLIETGNALGQESRYHSIIYDEAGETMEGVKTMSKELRAVRDYLRECGQYNFLNILVLPEFFDLPKGIAITRSIFLIDVYYIADDEGIFQRGYFRFYSRKNKKQLYLKGKRELNYNAHKFNFDGRYYNFYPINEDKYRKMKQDALRDRESAKKEPALEMRNACWCILNKKFNISQEEISRLMMKMTGNIIDQTTISKYTQPYANYDI